MPKMAMSEEQKKNETASREFRYFLEQRGADGRNCAKWLAKKIGVCETTARKYVQRPGEMPICYLWALHFSKEEVTRVCV